MIIGSIISIVVILVVGGIALRKYPVRSRAELAALETERNIRILVESVEDYAIFMLDPLGKVMTWNVGAERIKGYQAAEIIGQDFSVFYSQLDIDQGIPQQDLALAANLGRSETQRWRVRKDGSQFLANLVITAVRNPAGALIGYSEISRDVTERRAAERHIAQMESRYRGLLEAAPDSMIVVNQLGSIVLLNIQAEKQFGYRRDELLGQAVTNIIPNGFAERLLADDLRSPEDALAQQIGGGLELQGRHKDGHQFPVEIMLSPLDSPDGILVTAAVRDITGRKIAEEHLLRTVQELKRSNDELQQFAYVASHDLQEPLRMVASYTELLAKRYKGQLDADADEFIAYAVDGAKRMQRMIQDLLTYSHAGTRSEQQIRESSSEVTLNEALRNLRVSIEENGAVVTHESLPAVLDNGQLTQVFQNLVGNAIKYHGTQPPRVHVSAAMSSANEWVFSVRDNGLGIEPQYFERIFGLFQRLHGREDFPGTGIGLAICKKILEKLGGRIWVESEPQFGSTFHFSLPVHQELGACLPQ